MLFCNGYTARAARAIVDSPRNFYNIGYMGGKVLGKMTGVVSNDNRWLPFLSFFPGFDQTTDKSRRSPG